MAGLLKHDIKAPVSSLRIAAWSGAALILLIPLVAMQFSDQVAWSAMDFLFAAGMIGSAGLALELAVRKTGSKVYRLGVIIGVAAAFLLIWVNGAVGIIGSENNDANLMYAGVFAVAVIGAIASRFRARGMSLAMWTVAAAQTVVTLIAIVMGLGGEVTTSAQLVMINGVFVAMWAVSATLLGNAADAEASTPHSGGSAA